jgi:hypothetical protein
MNPFAPSLSAVPELATTLFPQTSRYYGSAIRRHVLPSGKTVSYLERRFVPHPDRFALLGEHTVVAGDRPDNLAATYLGDPEQFWRIADANYVMNPMELTATVSRRLRITLPEGIPATQAVA